MCIHPQRKAKTVLKSGNPTVYAGCVFRKTLQANESPRYLLERVDGGKVNGPYFSKGGNDTWSAGLAFALQNAGLVFLSRCTEHNECSWAFKNRGV